MKKMIALFLAVILVLGLASCGTKENPSEGSSGNQVTELEKHTICVLVYNQTDDEVIADTIDFKTVHERLEPYRVDSFNFLKKELDGISI